MTPSADSPYILQPENPRALAEEMWPILSENHKETGIYALDFNPDYERYFALWDAGFLAFFTARVQATNELVGVAAFFIDKAIQQKEIVSAQQSVNYVVKDHRGKIGFGFMRFCDDSLKALGVDSVWRQASSKHRIGILYERMGYIPVETSYLRRL